MIGANDFKRQWAETSSDVLAAVRAVGESGWYILGSEVEEFETKLAAEWGLRHCVGVASGLDALEIGLRILGCRAGDRVLTTPVSAFATTLAIVRTGATPVFIDCDESGLIDLDRCEAYLSERPARFLVPVHLFGQPIDLDRLTKLRDRFEIQIVEDCAQAIGAHFHGRIVGTIGRCAATSFYPTKNLGAIGDGGALLTDDDGLAIAARRFRDYGQSSKYRHAEMGANSRLDELHAAILRRAHLPHLQQWTERRKAIAGQYTTQIHNPHISHLPPAAVGAVSCCHLFPILVAPARKRGFLEFLRAQSVGAGEHYPLPIFDQPALAKPEGDPIPHEVVDGCQRAVHFCASEVSLPIHPYLTDREVAMVIEACNEWKG